MNKILPLLFIFLLSCPLQAQSFFNTKDEYGDYFIDGEFSVRKPTAKVIQETKTWWTGLVQNPQFQELTDSSFVIDLGINIKMSSVPLIGVNTKTLMFKLSVKCSEGVLQYHLDSFLMRHDYAGVGSHSEQRTLEKFFKEMDDYRTKATDPSTPKKEAKQAQKDLEDYQDLLADTEKVMMEQLENFKKDISQ